jgi:hypothetical protein
MAGDHFGHLCMAGDHDHDRYAAFVGAPTMQRRQPRSAPLDNSKKTSAVPGYVTIQETL